MEMNRFNKEFCEMLFSTKFINKKLNANFLIAVHLNNELFSVKKESIANLFRTSVFLQFYQLSCFPVSARQQSFEFFGKKIQS